MTLDYLAQERILKRIWYSPAITNNLDSIRMSPRARCIMFAPTFAVTSCRLLQITLKMLLLNQHTTASSAKSSPPVLNSRLNHKTSFISISME